MIGYDGMHVYHFLYIQDVLAVKDPIKLRTFICHDLFVSEFTDKHMYMWPLRSIAYDSYSENLLHVFSFYMQP